MVKTTKCVYSQEEVLNLVRMAAQSECSEGYSQAKVKDVVLNEDGSVEVEIFYENRRG